MSHLLQQWVTEQAERRAASIALVMRDEGPTYGQLEERTNQLARMLKDQGCRRGDRVCLLMPKSPSAIVAILGVLKADCVYVPVDLACPVSRLAHMVASAEPRCILATGPAAPLLDALWAGAEPPRSISVGWMDSEKVAGRHFTPDFSREDCAGYGAAPLAYLNVLHDIAYILFTSPFNTDGFEGATICCAYVPAPSAEVTPATLRQELAQNLPSYMLPSRWMALGVLPKNANGKIDRCQLERDFQDLAQNA